MKIGKGQCVLVAVLAFITVDARKYLLTESSFSEQAQ